MNQAYSNELRADTATLLIPIVAGITALTTLLVAITFESFAASWHLWLSFLLAVFSGLYGWRALRREHPVLGATIVTAAHLCIFSLIIYQNWSPSSMVPYLFAILIVASSMFAQPDYGFLIWGVASLLTTIGISHHTEGIVDLLQYIAGPIIVNFLIAGAAYFSALEWQVAVESVSALHLKAQHRRDELFEIQEELRLTNAKLHSINEELEKARETAVAERDLRTRFMNQVSHELRTPINAIVNFAHILGQGELGQVNDRQVDYLARIEKSGWHSMSVLNDLLDLAQMNAGEFRLRRELADMKAICEEAISGVRSLLRSPDIALVRDYPEIWPQVMVDPKRFRQALLNLLGNAAKYTDEGRITLRVRKHQHTATFEIEDTGIGIAEEHHETVFEEFRQLDETIARQRIGTGLGLPISRHLIERHDGTLTLSSQPGKGSTFTITLPLAAPENDKANGSSTAATIAPERPF